MSSDEYYQAIIARSKRVTFTEKFQRDTKKTTTYRIECSKGLWSVEGPSFNIVQDEAIHYYRQYAADGEYDGTADEKLMASIKHNF